MKPYVINRADGDSANSGENFFKNLLNTIGPGGVKTDVAITLAPSNFIYMGVAIFIAVLAVWAVQKILTDLIFKAK